MSSAENFIQRARRICRPIPGCATKDRTIALLVCILLGKVEADILSTKGTYLPLREFV